MVPAFNSPEECRFTESLSIIKDEEPPIPTREWVIFTSPPPPMNKLSNPSIYEVLSKRKDKEQSIQIPVEAVIVEDSNEMVVALIERAVVVISMEEDAECKPAVSVRELFMIV